MKRILESIGMPGTVLLLLISSPLFAQNVVRGPYLQIGTPNSVIIKWRTDTDTDSYVRYGLSANSLSSSSSESGQGTEHEVRLAGLTPDTRYYYTIGNESQSLAGGDQAHFFVTSPPVGTPKPTRIWILGDSGTKNSNARAVRDAYYRLAGGGYTDLLLMLGDNAYNNGTDAEYQEAVFENMYEAILRQTPLWATRGNHDRGPRGGSGWTNGGDYYKIFTFPTNGEAGGTPSGTEAYYSFDYGNLHIICLESTAKSLRASDSPQWTWLEEDLAANTQDWTIAFWHHPPYSKGSHNSDGESELEEMRERALPLLEDAGVDLVHSGHSHSYERSFLVDGHYGKSETLAQSMRIDDGDGKEDGDGAYHKSRMGPVGHEGAVYIVAGSSGKTSGGKLNHPVMVTSLDELGSVVLDVENNILNARFIDDTGDIRDYFTIRKAMGNVGPPVNVVRAAGDNQVDVIGATLPIPLTVRVSDADNRAVAGVDVTFEVSAGEATLFPNHPQTTGSDGRASVSVTLGTTPGTILVLATAIGVGQPLTFTLTAIEEQTDTTPPAVPTNVNVTLGEN